MNIKPARFGGVNAKTFSSGKGRSKREVEQSVGGSVGKEGGRVLAPGGTRVEGSLAFLSVERTVQICKLEE